MLKVKFKRSPTGQFGLAYSAGQLGFVTAEIAKELEAEGYIEPIQIEPEDAIDKAAEQRETRPGRGKASGRRKKSE